VRFFRVILETAFLYRPSRPLGLLAIAFAGLAAIFMSSPSLYYLRNRSVAEWMIYRFLLSDLAGITACLCLSASYLTGRMTSIALTEESGVLRSRLSLWLFRTRWFWTVPIGFVVLGGSLILSSLVERLTTGMTYEHWSRYVVMSFCFAVAIILSVTRIIDYVLDLVSDRVEYLKCQPSQAAAHQVMSAHE